MANVDITRIAGNIGALNSLNSLMAINSKLALHQSRLSSGKRINSAADDPAGLTIATKLNARSEGLKTALDNIGDAKNLLATAESGMGSINDILVQMRNKAEQGASDTLGTSERGALVTQMKAYAQQIQDVVAQTKWNGKKLMDGLGDFGGQITFQTGADKGDSTVLSGLTDLGIGHMKLGSVAVDATTAGIINDAGGKLTGASTAGTLNTLADSIVGGAYTVKVVTDGAGAMTINLFEGNGTSGSKLRVNAANGANTGAVNTDMTASAGAPTLSFGNGLDLTVGALAVSSTYTFSLNVTQTSTNQVTGLTLNSGAVVDEDSSAGTFATYMKEIQDQLDGVSNQLTQIGSLTGRLTFKEDQVTSAQANVESSYNRIMNANMAEEQVNASKYQILQQTATAMLAQANQAPQNLLSLFR